MSPELWLNNLTAYSAQIAALAAAAAALAAVLKVRNPAALYRGWQLLLAVSVAVPLLQPWVEVELSRPAATLATARSTFHLASPAFNLAALILAVIGCGALVRLALLSLGLLQLRRIRRAGRGLQQALPLVAELREVLGVDAELYVSPLLDGAVSFGLRHPTILLPEGFSSMAPAAQKAVLCHELLHVRRRDWGFALAEEFLRAIFWFHPAIWWVVERIHLAREQLVDREVIALLGEREPYLDALLQTAALRARTSLSAAPSFVRTRHLRQRVALILKEDIMSPKRLKLSLAAVAGALVLTTAWAISTFPLQSPTEPGQPAPLGKVYKVGDGISAPKLSYKIEPDYTADARQAKLQGTVVLAIEISPAGTVQSAKVSRGLGLGLDEKAVEAIQKWRFSPALKDGQPVAVSASVEVNFRLL